MKITESQTEITLDIKELDTYQREVLKDRVKDKLKNKGTNLDIYIDLDAFRLNIIRSSTLYLEANNRKAFKIISECLDYVKSLVTIIDWKDKKYYLSSILYSFLTDKAGFYQSENSVYSTPCFLDDFGVYKILIHAEESEYKYSIQFENEEFLRTNKHNLVMNYIRGTL